MMLLMARAATLSKYCPRHSMLPILAFCCKLTAWSLAPIRLLACSISRHCASQSVTVCSTLQALWTDCIWLGIVQALATSHVLLWLQYTVLD